MSKRQTNEKKSLFGQKRDLRRVRALARTCQETSKSHQNSDFLGTMVLSNSRRFKGKYIHIKILTF